MLTYCTERLASVATLALVIVGCWIVGPTTALFSCQGPCSADTDCASRHFCSSSHQPLDSNTQTLLTLGCPPATNVNDICYLASLQGLCRNCQKDRDCDAGYSCYNSGKSLLPTSVKSAIGVSCNTDPNVDKKFCFPSTLLPTSGGITWGDPHFRTFDGTKYSFHGQCDLVLVHSASMGSLGLPLSLHGRTTIRGSYSYISQAALQIGSDTLEITESGSHYLNGQFDVDLPHLMADRYPITKEVKTIVERKSRSNPTLVNRTRTVFKIDLDDGDFIEINEFKRMLYVSVNANLANRKGMLGVQGKVGLIGRDGVTVMKNDNEMGMEWQVRSDIDPQLFHDMDRVPQYPEQCLLPNVQERRRKLRSSTDYDRAKSACDDINDSDLKQFCIEDILLTGDFEMADAYSF